MKTNNQISSAQFLFIIFQTQVGVSILRYQPTFIQKPGKMDGLHYWLQG